MVIIKTDKEIQQIKKSCQLTANTLKYISDKVKPGIKTIDIDKMAEDYIIKHGGKPSFKGYGPEGNEFPSSACISINDEIVHGIPGERILREGDIVSIDIGTYLNGYYGDSAVTVAVGKISKVAEELIKTTKECLYEGIKKAQNGNYLGDIGYAIQTLAEKRNFSVVREFVGHGVGLKVHEDPQIPNYGRPKTGMKLEKGMVIAIEPMINEGKYQTISGSDGWTVKTADGSLSAHFEHTIAIYEKNNEILTV
ncbi:MAG: type I methionyl aminopeptidase [Candidatus Caldatribacteriota bacterium]|jgi:methionyl aminopeptidase|nr:type I methionyl aminopeptidase [Atribacterota bacterium]MDD3030910.1 type I methionyl aminopeptidase [Atribacterota bacterium]MDD3640700.1 type I methionyl aminopeptidase [Atribacterota bacterium]MDD4288482.1 type I methionyl aminopeptidase [Atribacterota bacterium]MDD4764315.1 type I methionyl aminopeptidase [Atribacterota bacterium]